MERFDYPPLSGKDLFRVLHLRPTNESTDTLDFTLEEARYEQPPQYTAISYTWDNQSFDTDARCNGALFKVTRNCRNILRCLRRHGETVTIWLDQICINQSSDDDKSVHVARMDEIYENCSKVLIWMTELPNNSIPILRSMAESDTGEGVKKAGQDEKLVAESNLPSSFPHRLRLTIMEVAAMRSFQFYSWHERMWTLQVQSLPFLL